MSDADLELPDDEPDRMAALMQANRTNFALGVAVYTLEQIAAGNVPDARQAAATALDVVRRTSPAAAELIRSNAHDRNARP